MLKLTKIFSAPGPGTWELGARSAVWEVQGYPGLWLRRAEDHRGQQYWRMFAAQGLPKTSNPHPAANQLDALLQNQKFPTRKQLLQAIEAALALVEL